MAHEWAYDYVAALNGRDAAEMTRYFEEHATLLTPDWTSGEYKRLELTSRAQIIADWEKRMAGFDYIYAVVESICEGAEGIALAYRINGEPIIEVFTVSARNLIASVTRYGGAVSERHIFYSYARGSGFGSAIASFMAREELPAWVDSELEPGEAWEDVIEERIASAAALIVIMDARSAASAYVKKEIALAQKFGLPIIPVLAGGEPFPAFADKQYALWNRIGFPEYGFSEVLRDLAAPGREPSSALKRSRVDYFVRRLLMIYFPEQSGSGEFGVGMTHSHSLPEDQPLTALDELDWAEVTLSLSENVPEIRFEDHFGRNYIDYGTLFPTPKALVDALLNILTWEQIRQLGRRTARMGETASDTQG